MSVGVLVEPLQGIHVVGAVQQDAEVQVRSGRLTGRADEADDLARRDGVALRDLERAVDHVRVDAGDLVYGAVELTARYSRLNLEDNNVHGGRQHDTTIGANWYLTSHFKMQANYSWVDSSRNGVHETPHVMELRAQVQF